MNPIPGQEPGEFDQYASVYDDALQQGLEVSGESKEFFARGRVAWMQRRLEELGFKPDEILDFGCGTGSSVALLREAFEARRVTGVDVSAGSLEVARREHPGAGFDFHGLREFRPEGAYDLAFCNGVFHHIPLAERAGAVQYVWRALRPGGLFALWENNPWNPGARIVMSRIPFDRDAVMLSPPETGCLLRAGGFEIQCTNFLFIFPRLLGWLRWLEPPLAGLPLGAQYLVLGRKPA